MDKTETGAVIQYLQKKSMTSKEILGCHTFTDTFRGLYFQYNNEEAAYGMQAW